MPVQYTSILEETKRTRRTASLFDVSHMGQFWVEGPRALDELQCLLTNDLSKLRDGQAQYSLLSNETGGVIDDLIVHRVSADRYFI